MYCKYLKCIKSTVIVIAIDFEEGNKRMLLSLNNKIETKIIDLQLLLKKTLPNTLSSWERF